MKHSRKKKQVLEISNAINAILDFPTPFVIIFIGLASKKEAGISNSYRKKYTHLYSTRKPKCGHGVLL